MIDFKIKNKGAISSQFLEKGIGSFLSACGYVANLPYQRTNNSQSLASVIVEGCGTCSSKHAVLMKLTNENDVFDIKLAIGIYRMSRSTNPKLKNFLEKFNLDYIPEAHCYLVYKNKRYDYTLANAEPLLDNQLFCEEYITPSQIGDFKRQIHQNFLKRWLVDEEINYSFDEIWKIREGCIDQLSKF